MRLIARVKAVRIEETWLVPGQRVRCVAHLTRPLSGREAGVLEASSKFRASEGRVTYCCRPEDAEEYAAMLELELGRAAGAGPPPPRPRRRPVLQ